MSYRHVRRDAVAKIEDMGPTSPLVQQSVDLAIQCCAACPQDRRVEMSLDRHACRQD